MAWTMMLALVAMLAPSVSAAVDDSRLVWESRPSADRAECSQQDEAANELEQLRRMLHAPGPEGREARASAVARLLAMATPQAHRLLQEPLLQKLDPDGLRLTILEGLATHLLGSVPMQFGGAAADVRKQILIGYVGACAPLWNEDADAAMRVAARRALRRVPARELDAVARAMMTSAAAADQVAILHLLGDMRQTLLAAAIATHLDASEEAVRTAAQQALQSLVYAEEPIRSQEEFERWREQFGDWSYLDLVERAARRGPQPLEHLRQQLADQRIEAAREFVTAHVVRRSGVDWAVVQQRTVNGNAAVLDACLEALQAALVRNPIVEGNAMTRQAFCRALLDRFRKVAPEQTPELQHRRALLLEVAAYLARPQEVELATEVRTQLLAQLAQASPEAQLGALRGLRRYPSEQARASLVAHATTLLDDIGQHKVLLRAILETLGSRTAPRWMAPAAAAADKADWLQLVKRCCRSAAELELREPALVLAQMLDKDDARVPEAFGVLLAVVKDPVLSTKIRSTGLIYLEAWRSDQGLVDEWVTALHGALEDDLSELRLQAAGSLARLPESVHQRRGEWFRSSLTVLRRRLAVEPDANVLGALVECVRQIGKQPQMSELAIGALKFVLNELKQPLPTEHQFRLEPLLQALAAIAADASADGGQWLAACDPLLANGKRQSVRLILQSHDAISLAKSVEDGDPALAQRARHAMRVVIEAGAWKPADVAWSSSEGLQREARDVRTAFVALGAKAPDLPKHRLLRLAVDLSAGRFQEVVQRAQAWLAANNGNGGANGNEAFSDQLRLLAAEAQLSLSKPQEARKMLEGRSANAVAVPAALALTGRIAQALAPTDAKGASELFERTLRATAVEDPAFRSRLLDWMKHQLQYDPGSRDQTLQRAAQHEALFEADDCPAELREAFKRLRNPG